MGPNDVVDQIDIALGKCKHGCSFSFVSVNCGENCLLNELITIVRLSALIMIIDYALAYMFSCNGLDLGRKPFSSF